MSLLKNGLSDSKYYLIANIGNKALAFLIIPILAKTVGVEQFAIYDLFLIISGIINIIIVLGMDSGISILLAESKDNDTTLSFLYLLTLIISISILLFLAIILGVIFIYVDKLFLLNREIWIYIILYELFTIISYHTFNFLRWRERAKQASFVTLFSYISGMLIGVSFLYFEGSIGSYLQGLVIGLFLGSLVSLYVSREFIFGFKVVDNSKELLKELLKLSLPFVPTYLGDRLMFMADRVVILMLFGQYELGLYALVAKLANIPQFVINTVTGGFMPVMLGNYESSKGKKLIKNFFHLYLIFIPISFIILYPISNMAVELFSGREYLEGAYLLPMIMVSLLFTYSSQATGFGYLIKRKTHHVIYIALLAVPLNYLLSLLFGYWIGLEGVILGTLVVGILKTYVYTLYSEKLYSFDYSFKLMIFISILSLFLVLFSCKGVA